MNPAIWGPPFWFVLHTIAINYPVHPTFIERRSHYEFFRNLQSVIPCEECRKNYAKHFKQYPIDAFLDSKYSLLQWTIIMHNLVNRLQGAPTQTTDEVIQLYRRVFDEEIPEGREQAEIERMFANRYCNIIPRHADGSPRCACGASAVKATAATPTALSKWNASTILGSLAVLGAIAIVGGGVFFLRRKGKGDASDSSAS